MIESITTKIQDYPKLAAICSGALLNFAFAPFFIWPLLINIGIFAYQIKITSNKYEALTIGWWFGFSFYTCNLYWISVGVSVYADQFWWAIPFALFGLPIILALYTMLIALASYYFRNKIFYTNIFTSIWIVFELLRAYLFTGFPWSLIGYSMAFSDAMIQISSIIGSYGLGVIIVFTFSSFCYFLEKKYLKFLCYVFISLIIWSGVFYYGVSRLENTPHTDTNIKLRLVQPSIIQSDKWSIEKFWQHFEVHRKLTMVDREEFMPDLIIWPEAAVILQPTYVQVHDALKRSIVNTNATLITGGVTDNLSQNDRKYDKIFASIYALKADGNLIFDYHKSHLVPFGEYVPFANILPINKLTPGIIPYSPGKPGFIVKLDEYSLKIRPLLCYEIIFPDEVRMNNKDVDLILNLTNDAYYGNTSGPYQHFYTTKMRAVENGLPLVRVANNGITGIFDPLGRIIIKSKLNSVIYIDSYLPGKLYKSTLFSLYGNNIVFIYLIVSFMVAFLLPKSKRKS